MVKRKVKVGDDIDMKYGKLEHHRPGKHSYIYYFKIESQKLKEEGVKVDEACRLREVYVRNG